MAPRTRSIAVRSIANKERAAPADADARKVVKHARRSKRAAPVSHFMELPGELRNAIYGFCQDSESELLAHRRRDKRSKDRRASPRSFYSLAHVSQQVRREYLPLYASRIAQHIPLNHMSAYVQTFSHVMPRIAGEITIGLPNLPGFAPPLHNSIDIAPLVRLCKAHPHLRVVLEWMQNRSDFNAWNQYHTQLGMWLEYCIPSLVTGPMTSAQAKWAAYFNTAVVAMYISPISTPGWTYRTDLGVRVVVKPAYVEWWMGFEKLGPRAHMDDIPLTYWAEKTGHYELRKLGGLVVRGAK